MKKLGLALAGGGGRGAYQIGVWKALRDTGLDQYITAVSGTSVGGLNAALFIQNDLDKAQRIWESISKEQILTPKSDSSHSPTRRSIYERDGLEKIIDDCLDMRCFDNSEYHCWMTCLCKDKDKEAAPRFEYERQTLPDGTKDIRRCVDNDVEYFNLKYYDDEQRKQIILATSAMPVFFPKEEINGHLYGDGGTKILGGDNVPVKPLYEIDQCDLILIVHLRSMDEPVNRAEYPKATLYEIFPKKDLGSILDFSAEGAKMRIQQGYDETIKLFQDIRELIDLYDEYLQKLAERYERMIEYARLERKLDDEWEKLVRENRRIKNLGGTR